MDFAELQSAIVSALRANSSSLGIDPFEEDQRIVLGKPGEDVFVRPPSVQVYLLPGNFLANVQAPHAQQASCWVFCNAAPGANINAAIAAAVSMAGAATSALCRKNTDLPYLQPVFDSPAIEFDSLSAQAATVVLKFIHPYEF